MRQYPPSALILAITMAALLTGAAIFFTFAQAAVELPPGAQEVRWQRVCYRSELSIKEIPVYDVKTKSIMARKAYETRVCAKYAIICTHHNENGAPLCLGRPFVHDHAPGEAHEEHSRAERADRHPGCVNLFPMSTTRDAVIRPPNRD